MARNSQNLQYAFKLNLSKELREKVDKMQLAGLNVSQIMRNYIRTFSIENATKIFN